MLLQQPTRQILLADYLDAVSLQGRRKDTVEEVFVNNFPYDYYRQLADDHNKQYMAEMKAWLVKHDIRHFHGPVGKGQTSVAFRVNNTKGGMPRILQFAGYLYPTWLPRVKAVNKRLAIHEQEYTYYNIDHVGKKRNEGTMHVRLTLAELGITKERWYTVTGKSFDRDTDVVNLIDETAHYIAEIGHYTADGHSGNWALFPAEPIDMNKMTLKVHARVIDYGAIFRYDQNYGPNNGNDRWTENWLAKYGIVKEEKRHETEVAPPATQEGSNSYPKVLSGPLCVCSGCARTSILTERAGNKAA